MMKLTLNELKLDDITNALDRNGFGYVTAYVDIDDGRPTVQQWSARYIDVWSERDVTNEGMGFIVGRAFLDTSNQIVARWTLELESGRINRERAHGLFTDLLNANWS
jgi:hypothetical protein